MAITYTANHVLATTAAITSGSLTVASGDLIVLMYSNWGVPGTITPSNSGTAITWNLIASQSAASQCPVYAWYGIVGTGGTITCTVTHGGGAQDCNLSTIVHKGVHATTPVPAGNRFTGHSTTGSVSQTITPTATGSALWMMTSNYNAKNNNVARTNCTIENTRFDAGNYCSVVVRPTTQPKTDSSALAIGTTNTDVNNENWVAFEVQAAAGGTGITADASIVESADSLSATGALSVSAALAKTEASDTVTSSASVLIVGVSAITESIDSISATGTTTTEITANASIVESADSLLATGVLFVGALLAKTETSDTVTIAATAAIASALSVAESSDSLSSTAAIGINAVVSKSEASDVITSATSLAIIATAAINEANDSINADGSVAALGGRNANASIVEAADSVSSTGTVAITGNGSIQEAADSLTANSALGILASVSVSEAQDSILAVAGVAIAASALLNESADSLNSDGAVSAVGNNAYVDIIEAADTLTANATGTITASLAINEAADGLVSSGVIAVNADLLITESADSLSAIGGVAIEGVLAVNEGSDSLSADGFVQEAGSVVANLSIIEADDVLSSDGTVAQAAVDNGNGQIVHIIHYVDKSVQPRKIRTDYYQPVKAAPPLKGKDKPAIQVIQPENSIEANVNAVLADDVLVSDVSVHAVPTPKINPVSIEKSGKTTVVEITKPLVNMELLSGTLKQDQSIDLSRDDEDALLLILLAAGL